MGHHTEAFVGIDTSKSRNAIAIADGFRGGEVRYLGEFPATEAAIRKLVVKLAAKYRDLTFCYEAGPTGYGLYRLLKSLGHECLVVAPSLVPKKVGDRVKTNRRDAVSLAKLLRAGELTAVWVPDERHEAMRDLSRARQAVKKDLQGKRQQISSLMLRLGRIYPGKTTWGPAHMKWLMAQKLEHREQRIAFEELLEGIRQESERVERLENAIREAVPEWSLAEVVAALQAVRGIDLIAAVGVLAEIGDLSRFQNPRELMGALAKDGTAIKQIVRKTGHSRNRVRQVLRGDRGDVFRTRQSSLDAHLPLLDAQWAGGFRNGAKLWRRLKLDGFRGSQRVVSEWATRRRRSEKASDQQLQKVPSARTIARLMTSARDHMSKADAVTVAAIEAGVPTLVAARTLTDRFHTMIRNRKEADLVPWIAAASDSLIGSFASGVTNDIAAVHAALVQPWSNGQTEGQITKLKLVKRQMYGRAKIDLLQARLIGAT